MDNLPPKNKEWLERSLKHIPWGTQTNAKRHNRDGMSSRPAFIERAKGCRMWDVDGREFIDYRAALGPIVLGYGNEAVDTAVREQMKKGVLFSMASPIEVIAAEALLNTVEWPEKIRFMKTGADATSCCLRLARSRTGRDHLLSTGYHGYQDWYALEWPNPGIPDVLRQYVHDVPYGDIEALDKVFAEFGDRLAASVVVPLEWHMEPSPEFLKRLREKCTQYGVALVFDEILTGFRMSKSGAVGYFGIEPDMVAYAKGMANGYPVSAYAGSSEWMDTLDQTIITTTYAGETLSLAAVIAVMKIFNEEPVHEHIHRMGAILRRGFEEIFKETGFAARTVGVDPAFVVDFSGLGDSYGEIYINLFNKLYERGIFANEQWFITYSHTEKDIEETLSALRKSILEII